MKKQPKYNTMSAKELGTLLSEKALALRTFRFALAGSNTRNVKEGTTLKKDIARIKTAMSDASNKLVQK